MRLGDRWVLSGAPWWSLGSSMVVVFTRVRPEGRWIHKGAPFGSMGLSGIVVFTQVIRGGRWVHPGSLGSFGCALGEFRFMRGRCIQSGVPWG